MTTEPNMLLRFSLYGFFKNQRYFEPFLALALLEKGMSFLLIGVLIAFREAWINLIEIPSGAAADVFGRRKAMIVSFSGYIVSFIVFGFASNVAALFVAMFFYAVGDAFRSGTHKAMIFDWLKRQGRENERTKVYGFTRSWSKIGSAVSVALASVFVFISDGYSQVFFYATIPYVFGIINLLGYPAELDGERENRTVREALRHMRGALKTTWRSASLRRLMMESSGYEGVFHATKDYLQPVLKASAIALFAGWAFASGWSETQRAAALVAPVYGALYLVSAAASRNAHRVVSIAGGEESAARWLWLVYYGVFTVMAVAGVFSWSAVLIGAFIMLSM